MAGPICLRSALVMIFKKKDTDTKVLLNSSRQLRCRFHKYSTDQKVAMVVPVLLKSAVVARIDNSNYRNNTTRYIAKRMYIPHK